MISFIYCVTKKLKIKTNLNEKMDKRKVLPLLAIEKAHTYKCTYNMMWQLSSTLLNKVKHSSIVSEHK